ncbi:glycosyltransferase family 2 protein [Acetatifactor aquisgranensis]|uniref:glycosyltransferase family 2 protein n=1 Tax=Acetatifactor aquisgranensis TaxID=2941233 RepID=UPI00203B35F7|nr:glycosyltransferase [Acetatifactor aquisgranensis]
MKELISIIVPIYNSEQFLTECLDSLQMQSYRNIEVIMINDGSGDGSPGICRRYCECDPRFILLEQENKGLPMARNAGLDIAKGAYICFVDSDDFVGREYVEILYSNIKEYQADVSMCNYVKFGEEGVYDKGEAENKKKEENDITILDKVVILRKLATVGPNNQSEEMAVCWNKMVSHKFFEDGLRFPDKLHEDEFMVNEYIFRLKKAVWTDDRLYYYRQRSSSIMGERQKKNMRHLDALEAIRSRIELFKEQEYITVFTDILYSYFENAVIMYFKLFDKNNRSELKRKIYPQYFATLWRYRRKLGLRKQLRYGLFLISPKQFRRRYWI